MTRSEDNFEESVISFLLYVGAVIELRSADLATNTLTC